MENTRLNMIGVKEEIRVKRIEWIMVLRCREETWVVYLTYTSHIA